ncbi:MAG: beta-ketoacyl synthase N-terminal-like domain-containing protein [Steroidobacteraceae bacterium]
MRNRDSEQIVITGAGVSAAVGQGKAQFLAALLEGRHRFDVMQRPGRQSPAVANTARERTTPASSFLGAEIAALSLPQFVPRDALRTASFSAQVALTTLAEAWDEARLDDVDPQRIGLVVGGSNFQQRELVRVHDTYRDRMHFLRPSYALSFMDSDVCGLCTELFGIRAFAYTLGGASASGQIAILQAIQALLADEADVCIAMGALMDLSYWECQGLRSVGAMGSDRYAQEPARACRPFDKDRDGFIFGESCGAIVLERWDGASRSAVAPYARVSGWAMGMDGNRKPNPSMEGEIQVIQRALQRANLSAREIDYVNPHGTGSAIGDVTELGALRHCKLDHAYLNATKSIIGHGLSAAGTVETIAILLQMRAGQLHPTRNLDNPIEPSCNWVSAQAAAHSIQNSLKLSMGFGGVNSALCLSKH